jgi:hypothetical protein
MFWDCVNKKKTENLEKIRKFFGLAGVVGKRKGFSRGWAFLPRYTNSNLEIAERTAHKAI